MDLLTLDFETHYSREYSLTRLTPLDYILDHRFEPILCGFMKNDEPPFWVDGPDLHTFFLTVDWSRTAILCHNARFDGAILAWRYGKIPALYIDTMAIAQATIFAATGSVSLATCVDSLQLGKKGIEVQNVIGMTRSMFTREGLARYGAYCVDDVTLTKKLFNRLKPIMPAVELSLIDQLIRAYCQPKLALDQNILARHLLEVTAQRIAILGRAGMTAQALRSDPTLAALLQARGIEPPVKISPTTGQQVWAFAKSDEAFKFLLGHPDPEVSTLVEARLNVKSSIEQTRTETLLGIARKRWPDGSSPALLPAPLKYGAAHTHRLGGTDRLNLQNLPKGSLMREAIHARPGEVLVAADASQIEARILAWLAGQWDLVRAFAAGEDIYSAFASDLYGYQVTKETHPYPERHAGKQGILGAGFGCGPDKMLGMLRLQKIAGADMTLAQRVISTYRGRFPAIVALWRAMDGVLRQMMAIPAGFAQRLDFGAQWAAMNLQVTGDTVRLPNGLHLHYRALAYEGSTSRELTYQYGKFTKRIYGAKFVENLVQALARIIVLDKITDIRRSVPWANYALTIHDSLIYAVPEGHEQWFHQHLIKTMCIPPAWAPDLPLAAEGGWGRTLAAAERKR